MASISDNLTANLYASGLNFLVPGAASITENSGKYTVTPSPAQASALLGLVDAAIFRPSSVAIESGNVDFDLSAVTKPLIFGRVLPALAGVLFVGFLLGRLGKR